MNESAFNLRGLINFYENNVQKYENDIRSVAWGSRESQEKRFLVLSQMADLEGRSILDVGCGLGDLYSWLKARYRSFEYTGADITPSMINQAVKSHPGAEFRVWNINESAVSAPLYDFVFASGIFNRKIEGHEAFIKETIHSMFSLCKTGIAFNILSRKADFFEDEEYYADPGELLNYCMTLSRKAVLRHDYMPHDFTVYLYKGDF
ncbi:MAG: class I SAM-dependent methyltransferase [Nitrospirae bacterium]|nr:class I SAM-dependent methyltransferase [Nitrospirota bacterium]